MANGTQAAEENATNQEPAVNLGPAIVDWKKASDAEIRRRAQRGQLTRDVFVVSGD